MASLAARDQENLTHSHHTAAAAKPLNQSIRALQPKTPGHKALRTPFRGRQNDENAAFTVNAGKAAAKNVANGNLTSNVMGNGKQAEAVPVATPAPQQTRNALAPKTTNAKARAPFQTPAPAALKQDIAALPRAINRPSSLRKNAAPRLSLSQSVTSKLQIPVDPDDDSAWPEPEYAPPPVADLDDGFPDDLPEVDLTPLTSLSQTEANRQASVYYYSQEPWYEDGSSLLARELADKEETRQYYAARAEADLVRASESDLLTCPCDPECEGGECQEWSGQLQRAEEKYRRTVEALILPEERRRRETEGKERKEAAEKMKGKEGPRTAVRKDDRKLGTMSDTNKGPSDAATRRAAANLAMRPVESRPPIIKPKPRDYPKPWLTGSTASQKPAPEGHAARHAAAVNASKSTLGFSKGRSTSVKLRKTVLPESNHSSLDSGNKVPTRKTETETLREMWKEIREQGAEELGPRAAFDGPDLLDEHAEQDYVLEL